jgi:hypothetical protein
MSEWLECRFAVQLKNKLCTLFDAAVTDHILVLSGWVDFALSTPGVILCIFLKRQLVKEFRMAG